MGQSCKGYPPIIVSNMVLCVGECAMCGGGTHQMGILVWVWDTDVCQFDVEILRKEEDIDIKASADMR